MEYGFQVDGGSEAEAQLLRYIERVHGALQTACTLTCEEIRADFEVHAAKDTTAMANSVAIITADGQSDYAERSAAADALNPKSYVWTEPPAPDSPGATAIVLTRYAGYPEYGTPQQPPQPAWGPATEAGRAAFADRVVEAMEELGKSSE